MSKAPDSGSSPELTTPEEHLREYGDDEIERFLEEDRLDPETAARFRRLLGQKGPS